MRCIEKRERVSYQGVRSESVFLGVDNRNNPFLGGQSKVKIQGIESDYTT